MDFSVVISSALTHSRNHFAAQQESFAYLQRVCFRAKSVLHMLGISSEPLVECALEFSSFVLSCSVVHAAYCRSCWIVRHNMFFSIFFVRSVSSRHSKRARYKSQLIYIQLGKKTLHPPLPFQSQNHQQQRPRIQNLLRKLVLQKPEQRQTNLKRAAGWFECVTEQKNMQLETMI